MNIIPCSTLNIITNYLRFSTQGLTPLHVAASLGHDAIVKELVDLNNENAYSNPYFRIALPIDVMAEKTHDNSIESEEQPTDTTASTESTDVNAERDLSQDAMGVFPKQRVDINAQDDLGNTPLIYAVVRKSTYITKLLLEGNAEPNLANKKGMFCCTFTNRLLYLQTVV